MKEANILLIIIMSGCHYLHAWVTFCVCGSDNESCQTVVFLVNPLTTGMSQMCAGHFFLLVCYIWGNVKMKGVTFHLL